MNRNNSRRKHVLFRTVMVLTLLIAAAIITTVTASAAAEITKPDNNKEFECGKSVSLEAKAKWEKPEGGSNNSPNTITFRIETDDTVSYVKKEFNYSVWAFGGEQTITASFTPYKEGEYIISVRHDIGDVDWDTTVSEENPFIPDEGQTRTIKVWKSLTKAGVTVDVTGITDKEYTGEQIKQEPVVTVDGKQLVKDQDYTVSYSNNIELGEASVTITGQGFYKNSVTRTFQITPATITADCVSGVVDLPFTRASIRDKQNPVVVVNGRTLVRDTDYDVHFENAGQVGTATLIIAGKGYYTGEVRVPFQIIPGSIRDAEVTGIRDMAYTGEPVTLERRLSLKYKGYGIYENTDYTVTYKNNVNPGAATVIITGKTNFTGTLTRTFNIIEPVEYDSSNTVYLMTPKNNTEYAVGTKFIIRTSASRYMYESGVQVNNYIYVRITKDGQSVAYQRFPYTSTSDIIEVEFTPPAMGTYKIEVCWHSSYKHSGTSLIYEPLEESNFSAYDSRTVYVGVSNPAGIKDISNAVISGVTYKKYTGDSITQSPTVSLNGTTLAGGTDYYLSYTNNVDVGTATMTVRGKGRYTGTASKTFSILERTAYAKQALTDRVSALEAAGTSQYLAADRTAVQNAINAAKALLQNANASAESLESALVTLNNAAATAQTNLANAKKAAAGTPATSTVEKRIIGKKTNSDPAGSAFLPLQLKSLKQTKTSVTLRWKAVRGASGYVIYGSKCGKANKIKKLATVKKTSFVQKKLKKGTYYRYIVVAEKQTALGSRAAAVSKMIYVATKGGKVGNVKSLTAEIKKSGKWKKVSTVTVKKGKTVKPKITQIPVSKKLKVTKYAAPRFVSSKPKIATVSRKGVIKGKAKGTSYVFVFAQNGAFKRIKVVVK